MCNISTDVVMSALIASGGMWSGPAALFDFICLIASSISFFVGGLVLIGRSSLAGRISGGLSGGGRFSSCSKCSRQRLSYPSCSYISFPCLSFTVLVIDVLCLPEIILVVSYTIFICPQAAAFSALSASPSKNTFLSFFIEFLTLLLSSEYFL